MIEIEQRIQRAAESILENEALTAGLDDEPAKLLLAWGIDLAQKITAQTAGMDDIQAEEAAYRPMRALRKMLRGANQWTLDPQERGLGRVLRQAPSVYGADYSLPTDDQQRDFLSAVPTGAANRLVALRAFVEGGGSRSGTR